MARKEVEINWVLNDFNEGEIQEYYKDYKSYPKSKVKLVQSREKIDTF